MTRQLGYAAATAVVALVPAAPAGAATLEVRDTDDAGRGSLRAAIERANASPGSDRIEFGRRARGTIRLRSGELDLEDAVRIDGPGARRLTVSGNNDSRAFSVNANVAATIKDLTVADGLATAGDGDDATAVGGPGQPGPGGSAGSPATANGAPGALGGGGGILVSNNASAKLVDMRVRDNTVLAADGGDAIATGGQGGAGGASGIAGAGGNASATGGAGGDGIGGGIGSIGLVKLRDTIVTDNVVRAGDGGDATATPGAAGSPGAGGAGGPGGAASATGGAGGDARGGGIFSLALDVRDSRVRGNAVIPGRPGDARGASAVGGAAGEAFDPDSA